MTRSLNSLPQADTCRPSSLLEFRELSTLPISTIGFKPMFTMRFVQMALEEQLTGQEKLNNTRD